MRITSAGFTHRGGVREHNEDAYLEVPAAHVWLVADGMGGYQAGGMASRLACDTVTEALEAGTATSVDDLERALRLANSRIRQYGADELRGETIGSTVVALMICANRYHLFWVGDSRCYLVRQRRVIQLSRDHSQVADMVEQGLITPGEAEQHPLAHVITRALGVEDSLPLDYLNGEVGAGDMFLLCSDGVSKEFSDEEFSGFLASGEIEEAASAILHSALVKECRDNVTCIIVNVEEGCYSPPETDDATIPVYRDGPLNVGHKDNA